jgi:hypothetical protein
VSLENIGDAEYGIEQIAWCLSAFSKHGEHEAAVLFGEAIFGYGRMASLYTKAANRETFVCRSNAQARRTNLSIIKDKIFR